MTKQLLDYCWKYKLISGTTTTNGKSVEVLDQGLYSRREDTPTFFNAKLIINGTLWVGNVMTLEKASDWYRYSYDNKKTFANVVLIVCFTVDTAPLNFNGESVDVMQTMIPENVIRNYNVLMSAGGEMVCHYHIMQYTTYLQRHAWMAACETEHLEESVERMKDYNGTFHSFDDVALAALFRGFGFGVNDEVMEKLIKSLPIQALDHHRDDWFQVEAMVFGQAGLLELDSIPEKYQHTALNEGYFAKLRNEYLYLAHKFSMRNVCTYKDWKGYGIADKNAPHVMLSILANWIYVNGVMLNDRINEIEPSETEEFFHAHCTPYWERHWQFGAETRFMEKRLTPDRIRHLVSEVVVPFLFFIGRYMNEEELCDKAFDAIEQIKAFKNADVKEFMKIGIVPKMAGESCALTAIRRKYCKAKDCLRCRFGYEFIKKH